ncbi:MAG: helix-turn-helix transcriptional regulator [Lachnospiraceae bacterium]|nr:helix-turn-helix transcriptional regulator [Lachnospiraceae bacterium]
MLDCIAVGKKIQEYRIKNKYHQDQLAELLYVSRQAVSRWELGQAVPTIDNLITLTRLFGVSFEELLCLNEDKEIDPQNLFRGHNREYIVRRICDGDLKVDLPEMFWQFSPEERMQVLSSIKRRDENIDEALFDRLSTSERAFMRNNLNFIGRKNNRRFITESEEPYES